MLVFDRDVEVAEFVGNLIGKKIVPPFASMGVERDGKLVGGAIFNNWTGADIEMTLAGPGMLSRGVMRALAHYAFVQAGCRRVSMTVRLSNSLVRKLAKRCGFRIEGIKRHGYPDEDAIIFGLLADDFPWKK
jgi:RimJ/RimL family protein N-acetyltransferase